MTEPTAALEARIARLEAENRALRVIERRYHWMNDNLPGFGMTLIDPEYRVEFAAGQAFTSLGVDGQTLIGKTLIEINGRRAFEAAQSAINGAFAGEAARVEFHLRDNIYENLYMPYAVAGDGTVNTVAILSIDITKVKKMFIEREQLQQEVIEAQRRTLQELSTPVIPLLEGLLIVPLIGSIDSARAREITRGQHRAKRVIIDITGVDMIDSGVADHLNKTIQAVRLKGAQTIITGISDAVAETVVDLGIDWGTVETLGDLQSGVRRALNR